MTLTRYSLSPITSYRLMKKEGRGNPIVWGQPQPAFLLAATPFPVKPEAALSPLKPVNAAPPPPGLRVAQLPPPSDPFSSPPVSRPIQRPAALDASASKTPPMLSVSDLKVDGASVLAGVTDADKPGSTWWSSAGTLLPTPIFDAKAYMVGRGLIQKSASLRNLIFALRLPASAQGVTVQYEFPQSVAYSSEGVWPFKMKDQEHQTEEQFDAKTGGARAVTAVFPASLAKANIKVGVAAGPWKVAATCGINAAGQGGNGGVDQGGHKFLFSPVSVPLSLTNSVVLSVSTDATDDLRVVAVTTQGQMVLPNQIGGNSIGTLDQITARFDLPLPQIKEFRVETRPFRWVEFKDVALQPAK